MSSWSYVQSWYECKIGIQLWLQIVCSTTLFLSLSFCGFMICPMQCALLTCMYCVQNAFFFGRSHGFKLRLLSRRLAHGGLSVRELFGFEISILFANVGVGDAFKEACSGKALGRKAADNKNCFQSGLLGFFWTNLVLMKACILLDSVFDSRILMNEELLFNADCVSSCRAPYWMTFGLHGRS